MSTKMLLTTKLDQRLVMNQQLSQAITLLQYNTLELRQVIQQFIENNPLIEIVEDEAYDESETVTSQTNNDEELDQLFKYSAETTRTMHGHSDESALDNYANPKSLREHLLEQTWICGFDESKQILAEGIIDAIDDNGWLTLSIEDIQSIFCKYHPIEKESIEEVLTKIKTFDPPGIAASDLRECLLLQIEHKKVQDEVWEHAYILIKEYFDLLADGQYKAIIKKMKIEPQEYQNIMRMIRSLNPKPGLLFSSDSHINVEPELYVKKFKNKWQVFLSDSILTRIQVNHQYHELIKKNRRQDSYHSLAKELQEAQWLINGLKRRNATLLNVATHIIKLQSDFLDYGQAHMRPLNIMDVSQALELHESTVSRVTTGKYIATPRGVFELKFFFPSYVLTQSGDSCSEIAVKEMIKDIVNQETREHIYSDSEIAALLKQKGLRIARRTVAKYRDALKILPSYQRMHAHAQASETKSSGSTS